MFYEPKDGHGLPKNPFNSLVVPRPIGWISTVDAAGAVNLAPYSFFNAVSYRPPTVMFSAGYSHVEREDGMKDSLRNALETGEFVHNLATWDTREAMNVTSSDTPVEVDEMNLAKLTPIPSTIVKPPRVKEAPVHFECKVVQSVELPNTQGADTYTVVFGEVVGIHIADELIMENGQIDIGKLHPIARMGYQDYSEVNADTVFTMERPGFHPYE